MDIRDPVIDIFNLEREKVIKSEPEDININVEYNVSDYFKPGDIQPLYCICNGVSEGDMVACDYQKVYDYYISVKRNGFILPVWGLLRCRKESCMVMH